MSASPPDDQAEPTPPAELPHDVSLRTALVNHLFVCRLDHAKLLAEANASHERVREAKALIREIALHRVFDRFSPDQEIELRRVLDSLVSDEDLAKLPFVYQPPEFKQPYQKDHEA